MLKRTCAALLAVIVLALCSLPVFGTSYENYDYSIFTPETKAYSIGGYVSEEAIEAFNQYSNDVEQQFGINLVFVITNDLDGEVEEFSDYLFLNAPLGQAYNDNIIMLSIDMTGRRVDLYTHGTGMQAITDRNTDYILDNVAVPALKSQNYENLPANFAGTAEQFIQQWQDSLSQQEPGGSPSPVPVPSPQPNTSIPKEPSKYDRANSFLTVSLLVSTLLTGVLLVVNISKHRPVKAASNANVYMNAGSFRLTENTDRFIRTYTTRVAIPKNDPPPPSSSSFSSSSSSSSSHSHSSGHSHGGGSRGF